MLRLRFLAAGCARRTTITSPLKKICGGEVLRNLTDISQEWNTIPVVGKASTDRTSAPLDDLLGVQHPAPQVAAFEMEHVSQDQHGDPRIPSQCDDTSYAIEVILAETRATAIDFAEMLKSRTAENLLVSRLKRVRTIKGPGYSRQAIQILEQARSNGVFALIAYNTVLRMLAMERWTTKDKAVLMEELVCHLKEDGLEPDIYTFNSIIFVYAQARMAPKAERAYEEMLAHGIEPTSTTLSNIIMAQSWAYPEKMYRTLAEMDRRGWVPNRGAHMCLISAMWQRKDSEGVVNIMRRMLQQGYQPTEATFAISLMAAGRLGYAEFAKEVFARRTAAGLEPKEEVYSSMMVAHSKSNRHEECLEYWRQLVCVDGIGDVRINLETYHCAIKSAIVMCKWDEVGAILDMMKSQGIAPKEQTFNTAIAACKLREGLSGPELLRSVDKVVELITNRGGVPSENIQLRLAVACTHANVSDRAATLFERAIAQGCKLWPFAWECYIRALAALKRYEGAKKAWMTCKSEGHTVTYRANELAMTAAQQLKDPDWALEVLTNGNEKRKKSSVTAHAIAIRVLAEAGRLEEARVILQKWRTSGAVYLNHKHMGDLLASCEQHGNTEVALEFLADVQSRSPPHRLGRSQMAFLITALCKHGRASDVIPLFESQLAVNYQPGGACFVLVANAAFEAGDRANTAKYCEKAKKGGMSASERAMEYAAGLTQDSIAIETEDLKSEADTSHGPGQSDKGEARMKGDGACGVRETSTTSVVL